jgi:hypothetical protein
VWCIALCAWAVASSISARQPAAPAFTSAGQLVRPLDYRSWVFVTSGLGMTYGPAKPAEGQPPLFDNVFVTREAYNEFLRSGTWPDKTVLIKENRMAESAGTLSKRGHFQADVMNLEIHAKDERFPGKWAFFVSEDGKKDGKLMPQRANCYSCHQDHAASDTTFVQFYPTLFGIAKEKGTLSAAYLKANPAK